MSLDCLVCAEFARQRTLTTLVQAAAFLGALTSVNAPSKGAHPRRVVVLGVCAVSYERGSPVVIGLLQGPTGGLFLMRQVPLQAAGVNAPRKGAPPRRLPRERARERERDSHRVYIYI